jgi:ferrous iron transport protein B
MTDHTYSLCIAGNPNSGKTTLFNALTGAKQHVGNWPGVTVEKKEGRVEYDGFEFNLIDLPGIYSLTAYSLEEVVSRDFILKERPHVVINIVDATNLERNLYLTTQLLELGVPLILALNMMDEAEKKGYKIKIPQLEKLLGVPVIPMVASKGVGAKELLGKVVEILEGKIRVIPRTPRYRKEIEAAIQNITSTLTDYLPDKFTEKYPPRWLALKLLEQDEEIIKKCKKRIEADATLFPLVNREIEKITSVLGDDPETLIADQRYGFASGAFREAVKITLKDRISLTDQIDKVLTSRILGIPFFILIIWGSFQLTFTLGNIPMHWIEAGFNLLGDLFNQWITLPWLRSLVVNGIIGGVGSVLVFLPNILILFLIIALLEDTGYMARAAFISDRVMHFFGLHGKSFIPMVIGFGCNVPAVMATRVLENNKDRVITILVVSLMSCSARLPIYVLFAGAFFPKHAGNVVFSIYLLGIILAIIMARFFRVVLFPGESAPFVMELPPYRLPTLKGLMIHMWDRGAMYVQKAGTVILAGSMLIWFLSSYPANPTLSRDYNRLLQQEATRHKTFLSQIANDLNVSAEELPAFIPFRLYQKVLQSFQAESTERLKKQCAFGDLIHKRDEALKKIEMQYPGTLKPFQEYRSELLKHEEITEDLASKKAAERAAKSYAGRLGRFVSPVLHPLGFDWRNTIALISGLVAKEIVVGTMGVIYQVGEAKNESQKLIESIRKHMTPLTAYVFMVFSLIYLPCIATIGVIKRELNSWKWTIFSATYTTVLAWIVSFIFYQGGRLLGLG